MRCRKSQDREHKRDSACGYGEDHNAVVRKKHGVHLSALLTQSDAQATEFKVKGSDRGHHRPPSGTLVCRGAPKGEGLLWKRRVAYIGGMLWHMQAASEANGDPHGSLGKKSDYRIRGIVLRSSARESQRLRD